MVHTHVTARPIATGYRERAISSKTRLPAPLRLTPSCGDIEMLVAISVQCSMDCCFHAAIDRRGSTQVAPSLRRNCLSQVACAAAAMHRFAFG